MNIKSIFQNQGTYENSASTNTEPIKLEDKLATIFGSTEQISNEKVAPAISELFENLSIKEKAILGLTREQILVCFTMRRDEGLINADVKKEEVYSEESIMPEIIKRPDVKGEQCLYSGHNKEQSKLNPNAPCFYRKKAEVRSRQKSESYDEIPGENIIQRITGRLIQPSEKIEFLFAKRKESEPIPYSTPEPISKLFEPEAKNIKELFGGESKAEEVKEKKNERKEADINNESIIRKESSTTDKSKSDNPFLNWDKSITDNERVWYYKDLQEDIQGPFSSIEMNLWNKAGYLFKDLMVNLKDQTNFNSLEEILAGNNGDNKGDKEIKESKKEDEDDEEEGAKEEEKDGKEFKEADKEPNLGMRVQLDDLFGNRNDSNLNFSNSQKSNSNHYKKEYRNIGSLFQP